MPIIAVVGAAISIGVAGAAVAGAVAGTVAIATAGFAVLGAVGATLGAVGAVTHNKTLSMIGLGLGVVGGIGGIASSAGVFGAEAGSIFTPASQGGASLTGGTGATFADSLTPATTGGAGTGGGGFVDNAPWDVPETAVPAGVGGTPTADAGSLLNNTTALAGTAAPTATDQATQLASLDMAPNSAETTHLTTGVTDTASDPAAPPLPGQPKPDVVQAGQAGDPIPPIPPETTPPAGKIEPWQMPGGKWAAGVNEASGTFDTGSSTTWLGRQFDGVTSWAKENPILAAGLVQGGFGLLKGLGGTTDAQNNYYNATAQANLAQARLHDQQFSNIAAPKAVAYTPPIGGVPGLGVAQPQAAGLINRASTAGVTGAVA